MDNGNRTYGHTSFATLPCRNAPLLNWPIGLLPAMKDL
jgi:hypothetical protein